MVTFQQRWPKMPSYVILNPDVSKLDRLKLCAVTSPRTSGLTVIILCTLAHMQAFEVVPNSFCSVLINYTG